MKKLVALPAALAIALAVGGCGHQVNAPELFNPVCKGMSLQNRVIPPESDPHDRLGHYDEPSPPTNFHSGTPWLQFVAMDTSMAAAAKEAIVYVRSYRLHALVNGRDTVLTEITAEKFDPASQSGLFTRFGWYAGGQYVPMSSTDVERKQDVLVFHLNRHPLNIWHVWGFWLRITLPAGTTRCWSEAEVALSGNVCLQDAFDWWRDPDSFYDGWNVNNIEGAVSTWTFPLATDKPMLQAFQTVLAGGPTAPQTVPFLVPIAHNTGRAYGRVAF